MLPQWHEKDPGHSAKSAGGQLTPTHTYILNPMKSEWAYCAVHALCRNLSGKTSSYAAHQEMLSYSRPSSLSHWTNPGLKSEIGVCELIFTLQKKTTKKRAGGDSFDKLSTKILVFNFK